MIRNRRASSSVTAVSSALAFLLSSAVLLTPRGAHALVAPGGCEQACVKGFTCQAVSESDCAPSGCAPGQPCEPPPPCEPITTYECLPAACTTDSDCATGMACVKRDSDDDCVSGVSSQPCAPGTNCEPPPPPPPCEQKTEQTCVPRYHLPCKVAADCGSGFACEEMERCSSSDSEARPGGSGDVAPPIDPAPPQCEKSGVFHCTADLTECNFNSDCPSGWTCITVEKRGGSGDPGVPPSAGTDGSDPGSGNAGASPQDGPVPPESAPLPPDEPTTTARYCAPPYYDLPIRDSSLGGSIAGSSNDSSSPSPESPTKEEGGSGAPASETSGGCRTSTGHAGSDGPALLGALGLLGLLRRRVRR